MSKYCYYALGGINYKNGVITTCPRQADQLVYAHETILPSKIFNHKNFLKTRERLYNDVWPTGCYTCQHMEEVDNPSMRMDYVLNDHQQFCKRPKNNDEKYGKNVELGYENLLSLYDNKTHEVDGKGLRHLELRFSTACNFACLHCSDVYSSGWKKKINDYLPDEEDRLNDLKQLLGTEHRHGPNDKNEMSLTTKQALEIVDDLNENFPKLTFVDFAGGEVLYQKQFFPTLNKLAEHPNAKNMNISFHSNFNADFSITELCECLRPFGSSTIIISVDAGRTFYSYFRHGGDWDKLKNNISEFKKINDFTHIDISCTASIYQMLDIYDVIDSFIELNCFFDASIVQTPFYLDPSLIMLEYKEETLMDFKKTYDLLDKHPYHKIEKLGKFWLDYIYDYVSSYKPKYKNYNRWLVYRKKSDKIWNQNFNDFFLNYQIVDDELVRVR